MAPVLLPVALAAGAGAAGVGLGVTTVAAAALSVGVTAVAAGVGYLTQPKPKQASAAAAAVPAEATFVAANEQRDISVRQAIPPRRFVYGDCRIGGAVFFQDNANPYLYIGVAVSDGEILGAYKFWVGDVEVPVDVSGAASLGTIYYQNFLIEGAIGSDSQAASSLLTGAGFSGVDSNFRQRGVARVVFRFNYGATSEQYTSLWGNGITPTMAVQGVKMYDPRTGGQSATNPATWAYRANPALAVAHALTNAWGVSLNAATDIDWASFAAGANVCDATETWRNTTVKMFEISGIFQSGTDLASQITAMLESFGGVLIDVDGKIGLAVDGARSSLWTITDADIIELGRFDHAADSARMFNAIKARFFDSQSNYVEDTTPVYQIASAVAAEGLHETALDLRFTPRSHSAQVLAYRELYRSRAGKSLSLTLSDAALYLQPLDVVTIASTAAPFINGSYEVVQVDLAQFGATLQLREYAADAYAHPSTYWS